MKTKSQEQLPLFNIQLLFRKGRKHQVQETIEAFAVAILAALLIRTFVIQAFRIPTASMEDTLLVGDFLLVNKFVYGAAIPFTDWRLPGFTEPENGDVIVFKYPLDESKDYIKRCIAVPGQTVEIRNKVVYIDGKVFPHPPKGKFIDPRVIGAGLQDPRIYPKGIGNKDNYGPVTVPENSYFAMGDNRDNSEDSRYWGFVPGENIRGEALIIYFSWNTRLPLYRIFEKIRWKRITNLIR